MVELFLGCGLQCMDRLQVFLSSSAIISNQLRRHCFEAPSSGEFDSR
jgi:hypothetical protein